jgi:hypothetical protein
MKSKKSWTATEEQFLIEKYNHLLLSELANRLNRSKCSVKTRVSKLKLRLPDEIRKQRKAIRSNNWSALEDQFLRVNYELHNTTKLAKLLNRTGAAVTNRLHKLNIYLPEHLRVARRLETAFKPGSVPVNKGKRWDEYMSKEGQQGSSRTTFRPGHLPLNAKFDSAVTVRKDNRGVPYKWVRISQGNWEMLHVHTYKKIYRTVPKGYIVFFKNGDTMDCRPANLGIQTRAENMKKNTIHRYPEELKNTIRTLTKLKKVIHGKKQNQ